MFEQDFWNNGAQIAFDPCKGCEDWQDGDCVSKGGCGKKSEKTRYCCTCRQYDLENGVCNAVLAGGDYMHATMALDDTCSEWEEIEE